MDTRSAHFNDEVLPDLKFLNNTSFSGRSLMTTIGSAHARVDKSDPSLRMDGIVIGSRRFLRSEDSCPTARSYWSKIQRQAHGKAHLKYSTSTTEISQNESRSSSQMLLHQAHSNVTTSTITLIPDNLLSCETNIASGHPNDLDTPLGNVAIWPRAPRSRHSQLHKCRPWHLL